MAENLPLADELTVVFARMSGLLMSEETVSGVLKLVTSLATQTIPGTLGAGVTLLDEHGRRTTAAASDPLVERADSAQYELDEGPCLTAWAERVPVRVDEIGTDGRWPRWARAVRDLDLDLHSCMSAPLLAADTALGAIKVYSATPGAYDARTEHVLILFAAQAAIVLANMRSYQDAQRLSDGLKDALRSRDAISQAKGILMGRENIDGEAAFAMLVAASHREKLALVEIARAVTAVATRRHP